MKTNSPWVPAFLSAAAGGLHWLFCSLVVGGEAWDGSIYFILLPLLAIACAAIGALAPERAWRWGAIAAVAQAAGLFFGAGEIGPLFPIGLAILAMLGACLSACSALGAYLASKATRAPKQRDAST